VSLRAARTWRERDGLDGLVAELGHELDLPPLVARILAARGIHDHAGGERFLARRLTDLHPPEMMRDLAPAAARLAAAIEAREPILIHGDYDVDGCTATALLARFIGCCGHLATPWVPDRRIDGYGLGEASQAAVRQHGSRLMVTVDCGIADGGWAARIEREDGCDVIVTDHHLPSSGLPSCTAVCDPNRPDCPYPDKGLAGVGVAWKLCWATAKVLCGTDRISDRLRTCLLDGLALVALGTVADCAPLTGENRILVHHGLKRLPTSDQIGLRALLRHAGCAERVAAHDVAWRLGPLLNAAGRLGSALPIVHLLTTDDPAMADHLLTDIDRDNEERRRLTSILATDLVCEVEADPARFDPLFTLVFAGAGWHPGVIGIVAARLADRFGRPAAVIAIDHDTAKGSLRSVPAVHLGQAIDRCRDCLLGGGGHAMAAGITLRPDRIPDFTMAFEAAVRQQLPGGLPPPDLIHDATVAIGELDGDLFAALERLAPFGIDNPEPVLCIRGARFVTPPSLFGRDGNHLKGAITDATGGMRQFLMWNARDQYAALAVRGRCFDFLVRPEVAWFRDRPDHRLIFVDGCTA
jgi:single-stranded-DNA-specific exonuclease